MAHSTTQSDAAAPAGGAPALRHRPALDGLRGIAVVAVLLYHSGVSWARGGFLGVDVFFVLSGFLITSLLLREHQAWGSIDLRRFWARRARRLLPALLLVLTAVAAYAAVLAEPGKLPSLRLDALATLGYVANWRFAFSGQGYFDQFGDPSPLRHMWSLGIEEQWYVVFPLVLVLLLRSRRARRLLPWLLVGAALASAGLAAALYTPGEDPSRVYYGTDTRAQTLLVGAALAVVLSRRRSTPRPPAYLQMGRLHLPIGAGPLLWPVAGVALLVAFVAAQDSSAALYRGGFLVVALLSAALVTAAVTTTDNLVRRVLTWSPLRHLGLVSYGLYLWHWPVYVALTPDRTGLSGVALLAVRLAVSLAVAELSYRLVEHPIRTGALPRGLRPPQLRLATGTAVALVVGLLLVGTSTGTAPLTGARPATALSGAPAGEPHADQPVATPVTAYLVGDSVPYGLREAYREGLVPGLSVRGSGYLGCGLMTTPRVEDGKPESMPAACRQWTMDRRGAAPAEDIDVAAVFLGIGEQFDHVVGGRRLAFGSPAFAAWLERELDLDVAALAGSSGRPVALVTLPCHRIVDPGLGETARVVNDGSRVDWLNAWLADYASRSTLPVEVVDLHGHVCPGGVYQEELDGARLHTDGLHFGAAGAAEVWAWLGPQLQAVAATDVPVPAAG